MYLWNGLSVKITLLLFWLASFQMINNWRVIFWSFWFGSIKWHPKPASLYNYESIQNKLQPALNAAISSKGIRFNQLTAADSKRPIKSAHKMVRNYVWIQTSNITIHSITECLIISPIFWIVTSIISHIFVEIVGKKLYNFLFSEII